MAGNKPKMLNRMQTGTILVAGMNVRSAPAHTHWPGLPAPPLKRSAATAGQA